MKLQTIFTHIPLLEAVAQLDERSTHSSRTQYVNGWEVVLTTHGQERDGERTGSSFESRHAAWDLFLTRVIAKIERIDPARRKAGEYLFTSRSANQSVIFNVDPTVNQLRVITILPPGRHMPKPGTPKVLIESIIVD